MQPQAWGLMGGLWAAGPALQGVRDPSPPSALAAQEVSSFALWCGPAIAIQPEA